MTTTDRDKDLRRRIGMTAAFCAVFVAAMVGMAFASVPLYRIFCALTGYGGTTQRASAVPKDALSRTVTVRFDANVANGLGWSFRPETRSVTVKVGAPAEVAFLAENRTGAKNSGVASFNVTPVEVGAYFNKIACFCFSAQTLAAGEAVRMPVVFFVDPSIADDHELDGIDTITLSYTFFPAAAGEVPAKPVASVPARPPGKPVLTSGDGNG
jgi:cytochrome c oxidase assembly protein subunit 11